MKVEVQVDVGRHANVDDPCAAIILKKQCKDSEETGTNLAVVVVDVMMVLVGMELVVMLGGVP